MSERVAVFHELGVESSQEIGIAEEVTVGIRNCEFEFRDQGALKLGAAAVVDA